jgi:hypothetical protein
MHRDAVTAAGSELVELVRFAKESPYHVTSSARSNGQQRFITPDKARGATHNPKNPECAGERNVVPDLRPHS